VRLPWPFGRSEAAPAETEPETGPAAAPGPMPPGPAPVAPPTRAWTSLPPIQRAIGEPPLVAPARTFLADVPGANPLPPIVGQLGHDVTPLAPAGLVAAPVHPVASLTSHDYLVGRPVQRKAAVASEPEPGPAASAPLAADAAPATTPASTSGSTAGPVATSPAPAAPAPVDEPLRTLAIVPPAETASPPSRSLTHADAYRPPAASDRPLVHRTNVQSIAASTSPAAMTGSPASARSSEASTRVPGELPQLPARTGVPASASLPATPRRPGLGAPLAAPPTAVQTSPHRPGSSAGRPSFPIDAPVVAAMTGVAVNPLAGSTPLYATVQRRGAAARASVPGPDGESAPAVRPDRAGSPQAPYVGSPLSGSLPSLPVVARSSAPRDHGSADDGAGPGIGASSVARTPAEITTPTASLPLSTTLTTSGRRRDAAVTAASAAVQRSSDAAPPGPPERRPLVAARSIRPLGSPTLDAGADGHESSSAMTLVTPSAADDGVASSTAWPAGPPAPAMALAAVQRTPDADAAAFGAPSPFAAGSATGFPVVQSSRHESPQMTLARPPAPVFAAPASLPPTTVTFPGAAAFQAPGIVAGPSASTVQTMPAGAPSTVPGPTATPVVQRIDGSAPTPSPDEGGGEHSDAELEALSRALFPRFHRQLKLEYLYEREARGLPFDN
jgi:hypothetical protein